MTSRIAGQLSTKLTASPCPYCGCRLNATTAADPRKPDAAPAPGDYTICFYCTQILVFGDDMTLRAPRTDELADPVLEELWALQRVLLASRKYQETTT
jgi:hypothetical protein